jgi:hypothetical protein
MPMVEAFKSNELWYIGKSSLPRVYRKVNISNELYKWLKETHGNGNILANHELCDETCARKFKASDCLINEMRLINDALVLLD